MHKSLLINAFKTSLQTCLFKSQKFPLYLKEKELITILLYSHKMFQLVKTRVTKTISKNMKFCKLKVIFQTSNRL